MSEEKKEGLCLKGRVVIILPEETINKKDGTTMVKKQFVIETEEQYSKKVCFQVMNEKVKVPTIGTLVDVNFNIESREYNGRWYNQNTAWSIWEQKNSAPSNTSSAPLEYPLQKGEVVFTSDNNETSNLEDDLPF